MLRAFTLAVLAKCKLRPWRCLFDVMGTAWFILWSNIAIRFWKGRPDDYLVAKRALWCENCPIYNKELMTCGTPGDTYIDHETGKKEQYGCWCWLPGKIRLHVDCWMWKRTNGELGWPDELNATFYERKR